MLQKQPLDISFVQGLDLKTDPFRVSPGKFLSLSNSIFDTLGRLTKRNGFGPLTELPDNSSTFLTTFNGNLTAIGTSFYALSAGADLWVNKGNIQPLELSVLPLIRNNTNQSQCDSVVAPNGLVCTVYTDNVPVSGTNVKEYKYVIADSVTGQNITEPALIPIASGAVTGSPRVFLLGSYFIMMFTNVISTVNHLQYVAIPWANPTSVGANTDIASTYVPSTRLSFDGYVVNNKLFIAYNTLTGGQAIKVTYLTSTLILVAAVTFASRKATAITVTADNSNPNIPIIYVSFYDSTSSTGYTLAVNQLLQTVHAPVEIISTGTIANITSTAQNGVCTVYFSIVNAYGYDAAIPTYYINQLTVTQAGTVTTLNGTTFIRSVDIASKAFLVNGQSFLLTAYMSPYQPTYFLINNLGQTIAKLAYSNGGGYLTVGLPNVTVTDNLAQIAYLYKDLIAAVNKNTNVPAGTQVNGIYAQLGINLASFTVGTTNIISSEIGSNLNITGGFIWSYDGYSPVEQLFHLYPDSVELAPASTGGALLAQEYFYQATYEWADNQGNLFRSAPSIPVSTTTVAGSAVTFTAPFSSGATSITVSSVTSLAIGQVITDTTTAGNITAGTYITSIVGSVLTLSLPTAGASAGGAGDTLSTTQTASVVVDVPTLRLTYKINNPVKIVIYRWSVAQQVYYQVTSILTPVLNNLAVDSIAFTDTLSDQAILGNNIIYTNGGVLENIAAPAVSTMTLFNDRLWAVGSEDPNLLYFSKQVIESTPVEMSDLLTLYTAPTAGAEGSTGPTIAIFPMDDKLVCFKANAIYYVNGVGPDNTGANNQYSDATIITASVGCSNQKSIVLTPIGLMFQSNKGIWLLGRDLSTTYIGAPVEAYNSYTVTSVLSIPATNQIRFSLSNGITLMYDYFVGQWCTFNNITNISSTLYDNLHTYLTDVGTIFQETPGIYLDNSTPVLMSLTTSWISLAGVQGYERFYWAYLLGQYITPFKLNVQFAYDYNTNVPLQSVIVTPTNISSTFGSDPIYGDSGVNGGSSAVFESRIFPEKMKCESFQVSINELYDATLGVQAGAGLTLTGLSLIVGMKKGYRTSSAAKNFG